MADEKVPLTSPSTGQSPVRPNVEGESASPGPASETNGHPASPVPTSSPTWRTVLKWVWPASQPTVPPNMKPSESSAREIVETVVFVVVLVLLLKSFIAEAFVIPTGSMAETLWGYQKVVDCPTCGYRFPVNCSEEVDPQEGVSRYVSGCVCPNCRQELRLVPLHGRVGPDGSTPLPARQGTFTTGGIPYREIPDPGWNSGDRVLVGKFLYEMGDPRRLDVVVFKFPREPQRKHVPMNYIKRLIGLPGETIAIHGGNLYYLPPTKSPKYDDHDIPAKELWNPSPSEGDGNPLHPNDMAARDLWDKKDFQIIRKPPDVIRSMMRIVYDNDHPPSDLKGKQWERWAPQGDEGRWTETTTRGFRHNEGGAKVAWLRYRNLLRDQPTPTPTLITDFMGYNQWEASLWDRQQQNWTPPSVDPNNRLSRDGKLNWVGDLILECEAKVEKAEGQLVLQLSCGVDRFNAAWDLSTGLCTLTRLSLENGAIKEEKLASKETAMKKKGTYRLRFANVDQRLVVWVDNSLPFGDGVTYIPPGTQGPTSNDLEPASVGVQGGTVEVSRLKLWRDTYYTVAASEADVNPFSANIEWNKPDTWNALRQMPVRTLYVQPGHYLCLGDNSQYSSDGRDWGLVPQRLMLGRALLVYYPFVRAGGIR